MKYDKMNKLLHTIRILGLAGVLVFHGHCLASADDKPGFKYDDKGRRDPFWKLISSTGTILTYETDLMVTDLELQGIMSGATGNIAMINGKVVRKNDKIGQFVIQDITDDWVLLQKDQQVFKLRLKKEE